MTGLGRWMRQCELERPESTGRAVTVAWLPTRFANRGTEVTIKGEAWRVAEVYDLARDADEVHGRSRDHMKQRAASDV